MRIAVWHNLPSGGGKRALFDHVRGLVARGHYVESWCPSTADQTYLPLSELISETVLPLHIGADVQDVGGVRSGWRSYKVMKQRLSAMDAHCAACAEQINRGRFDVLFANSCTFFRTTSIARHTHLPSCLYLQEPYRWLYEALPTLPWIAREDTLRGNKSAIVRLSEDIGEIVGTQRLRLQMREEIHNAAAFDLILVNSLYSRESILRAYGIESEVCYLGVDQDRFKPTGETKERYIVSLGGLYLGKGAERTIAALAALPSKKRPRLVWVGNFSDPTYERQLRKVAAEQKVDFDLRVRVGHDELRSLLSRATMMVYTPRLEPFGLAPLEANACGTPVVAIAEGGVRETVRHGVNGLLVENPEPQSIADAVAHLIDNPDLLQTLSLSAQNYVRDFWSIGSAIDRLEKALGRLSGNSAGEAESVGGQAPSLAHVAV